MICTYIFVLFSSYSVFVWLLLAMLNMYYYYYYYYYYNTFFSIKAVY